MRSRIPGALSLSKEGRWELMWKSDFNWEKNLETAWMTSGRKAEYASTYTGKCRRWILWRFFSDCFHFFSEGKRYVINWEWGQGSECWGLRSEKMWNTCLGESKCEYPGDVFNDYMTSLRAHCWLWTGI